MKITYIGHACFKVEEEGYSLVLDPYKDGSVPGYGNVREKANEVLCSHLHGDHGAVENVEIIDGDTSPFMITLLTANHDDQGGALRGKSNITIMQSKKYKVAHLGDLGEPLNEQQLIALSDLDVLLIPVGGHYTIDAKQASDLVKILKPRITIPMHYRTSQFGYEVIGTLDQFTQYFDTTELNQDTLEINDEIKGVMVLKPKTL